MTNSASCGIIRISSVGTATFLYGNVKIDRFLPYCCSNETEISVGDKVEVWKQELV